MIEMLALPLLLQLVLTGAAAAVLQQRPVNQAVVAGNAVEMQCGWNGVGRSDWIDWYHLPIGGIDDDKISRGQTVFSSIFKNDTTLNANETGQNNLRINPVAVKHAGTYTCAGTFEDDDTETVTAQLIVLATSPMCQLISNKTVLENKKIEMCCMIAFKGNLDPLVEWTIQGNDPMAGRGIKWENVTERVSGSLVFTLTITADSKVNGLRFKGKIFFSKPSTSNDGVANNTPTFSDTWESPTIEVLYGPRNVTITPSRSYLLRSDQSIDFQPGDELNCSADGNPMPRLQWINLETKEFIDSPVLTFEEKMIREQPYEFLCLATNPATNRTSQDLVKVAIRDIAPMRVLPAVFVSPSSISSSSETNATFVISIIAASLAAAAIIITTLVSYFICVKRKRQSRDRYEQRNPTRYNTENPKGTSLRRALTPPVPATMKIGPIESPEYLCPTLINSGSDLGYAEIGYPVGEGYLEFASDAGQNLIQQSTSAVGSRRHNPYLDTVRKSNQLAY